MGRFHRHDDGSSHEHSHEHPHEHLPGDGVSYGHTEHGDHSGYETGG